MHVAGTGYRRNEETTRPVSDYFEGAVTARAPADDPWRGVPYLPPSPSSPTDPEKAATRDLYVWIATSALVIGVIGGGIMIARHRAKKRRARR